MQAVTRKEAYERHMSGEVVLAVMSAVPLGALDLDTFRDSGEMIFLAGGESAGQKTEEKAAALQEDAGKETEEEPERGTELDEETLRKLYVKWRWSAKRIADKYNMDVSKVFRLLKQYGITRKAGPDDPADRSFTREQEIR